MMEKIEGLTPYVGKGPDDINDGRQMGFDTNKYNRSNGRGNIRY